MFCSRHLIPHEDCIHCQGTVAAMRPTVFAELAAAELRTGTDCCERCDYIFYRPLSSCPQCGAHNALFADTDAPATMPAALPLAIEADFIDLDVLLHPEAHLR